MKTRIRKTSGFTLTELMIVVMTVGLLASIAGPMFMRYYKKGQNGALVANLRAASDAFVMYSLENRKYPLTAGAGVVPGGMESYLQRFSWTAETPVGGSWNWDTDINGYKAGVAIITPRADILQMTDVDSAVDDGNLGTGRFRIRPNGYVLVIEE
jgi:prepilin-type N-terminal cleavage/methylation domain-containing protein